ITSLYDAGNPGHLLKEFLAAAIMIIAFLVASCIALYSMGLLVVVEKFMFTMLILFLNTNQELW
ncbi:hypothetical protein, partial [Caldicellulosiruptor sp. F32]|uniref:hypothetical protein n=1 Tax=Caldicellulosiruptor sp. F32 TaxID=1214564 RepID=UPI0005850A33